MHVCTKCGKKFKQRQHLIRHNGRVHPDKRPDNLENAKSTRRSKEGRKRQREEELPDDHWPDNQQLVLATGKAGDLLPWSSRHNVMLLAPSAVCGVVVPKKWTSTMACGAMGISKETLRGTRKGSGPTLNALREELKEVLCRYQQPQDEHREEAE